METRVKSCEFNKDVSLSWLVSRGTSKLIRFILTMHTDALFIASRLIALEFEV